MQVSQQDQWVLSYLKFANKIAYEVYRSYGQIAELEDLQQVAYEALVKCSKTYQPDRGVSFAGYSVKRIRGMLIDHLEDLYLAPQIDPGILPSEEYCVSFSIKEEGSQERSIEIGRDTDSWAKLELVNYLHFLSQVLNEREFAIVKALSLEHASQQDIAREYSLTAGRVSQILNVIREKIRTQKGA